MAVAIEFAFPWGRYHATAWDRSANEGSPDWPPAPWRILRALYATWRWHCPELSEDVVHRLLAKLAVPPRYQVPPFTVAHSRHYLPGDGHLPGVKVDTAKTLDAFVVTGRGKRLVVEFPVDLTGDERDALARLVSELAYLGRAESIVDARLTDGTSGGGWIEPYEADLPAEGGLDLLALVEPLDLDALVARPRAVRAARHRRPVGTRWVTYRRPTPEPASEPRRVPREPAVPTAVRFALTGSSLPATNDAVLIGDYLRMASLKHYGGSPDDVSVVLAGKTADGRRVDGQHAHAHYLAVSLASRKKLDTVVVWAPGGLRGRDLDAVVSVRQLRGYHREVLRDGWLGVEAVGHISDVVPELCKLAAVWRSATPFAPTRHGRGPLQRQLEENVRFELRQRGLRDEVDVTVIRGEVSPLQFRRYRALEHLGQARRAFNLQLTFAEPVPGPLVLGQLSHFGLGLFVPRSDG